MHLAQTDQTNVLDDFIQRRLSARLSLKGVLFLWLCNLKRQVAEKLFARGRLYLSAVLSFFCFLPSVGWKRQTWKNTIVRSPKDCSTVHPAKTTVCVCERRGAPHS